MIPRGDLHVFLGAAPGVGKTYAMLREAHRLEDAGADVVIGFLETHGRAETEALVGDLENIPRLQIAYRGITIEEMDTAAILARKPTWVLVDELAHTNAPGSQRERRYEDIRAIQAAGIHVLTTVNIQHLESLRDVVAGITGVQVNETIPDTVLDNATEVHLVDLPVKSLIERLEQGKVYPPERANQALQRFFRSGNLNALRELALRRTAAGVDDRLSGYMVEHEIDDVWPAAERIIVPVDSQAISAKLIRRAWHLASAFHAELVAVTSLEKGPMLELAEDLGATIQHIDGNPADPEILIGKARAENATMIVISYSGTSAWRRLRGQSLIDQLMRELPDVALNIVSPQE